MARILLTVILSLTANLAAATTFHLGNSLTWDTSPALLPDAQWAVFCDKSLNFIVDNPADHCIGSSLLWPEAMATNTYDVVVVQPYIADTIESATEDISMLMALQPSAQFIIHTGWATFADLLANYADPENVHSAEFIDAVIDGLPRFAFSTRAVDALVWIANDPSSPYADISELYRNTAHVTRGDGRYFMHNLLRRTMGEPFVETWTGGATLPVVHKAYLDGLLSSGDYDWDGDVDGADFLIWQREYIPNTSAIVAVPEPNGALLAVTFSLLWFGKRFPNHNEIPR